MTPLLNTLHMPLTYRRQLIAGMGIITVAFTVLSGCATPTDRLARYRHQPANTIFTSGEHALVKHHYQAAATDFEGLEATYPFNKHTEQGQLDIIYAYYKSDDMPSALAAAEHYIHLYPRSPHVDYAYYMKGLLNFLSGGNWLQNVLSINMAQRDLDYMRHAFIAFNELIILFPHSPYAIDAHLHMLYIRNLLADYELQIALFYLQRKAYLAAVNRASYVVQHYEGAPQVMDALKLMIKAYRALGEIKLADETTTVLHYQHL